MKTQIKEKECGFCPGRVTVDQLYTLSRVLEGTWEFALPVQMCFVDLEMAFDLRPLGSPFGGSPGFWGVGRLYVGCPLLV